MADTSGFLQAPPRLGNQYDDDRVLRQTLARLLPKEVLAKVEPQLRDLGARAAGEFADLCHTYSSRDYEPRHTPFDPWGRRIDHVEVSPAWKRFREVAAEEGLVATGYERQHGAASRLVQFALVYLFHPSSQIYTCPLAMTDGAARTLETVAPAAVRDRVLPHLLSRDPAQAWTAGQWMTERTGGSDVGLSETVARKDSDGTWRLFGNKWFTSAVTAEVALTLGRPEGNGPGGKGLALFLVELRDAAGRLQNIRVNRLKDKLGTRFLPTAELDLEGCPAIPLAGLADGVKNISPVLNITRTWNSICSISPMRRGIALARDYSGRRVAFGAALADKPLHLDILAALAADHETLTQLVFTAIALMGKLETGAAKESEAAALSILQPLMKLVTGKAAMACASEVVECFGGAGYCEDTGLPELLRDSQVLPIWEGTTNVLALEAARAVRRGGGLAPLQELVTQALSSVKDARLRLAGETAQWGLEHARVFLGETQEHPEAMESSARRWAITLGRSVALALQVGHAQHVLDQNGDERPTLAAQRFAARGVDSLQERPMSSAESRRLAIDS